jgi:hypothetical protein
MLQKHPDLQIQAEIMDINREFLRLLTHPQLAAPDGCLGIDKVTLDCMRRLSVTELELIAGSPVLLVEFCPLPDVQSYPRLADQKVADEGIGDMWQRELNGYANRLLIFAWHVARRDRSISSFHLGLEPAQARQLAQMSFTQISRSGEYAAAYLRARLSWHPNFWSDLVRAIRSGSPEQQTAALLAVIQLSVSCRSPAADVQAERTYY